MAKNTDVLMVQADAFTDKPFAGNPAAVCLLKRPATSKWMLNVAREMNLSETAFLLRRGSGYQLRWFTPVAEVDLCGHATLASAHVLWEGGLVKRSSRILFSTKSGPLTARRNSGWIELDFPSKPARRVTAPELLKKGLGVELLYVGLNQTDYMAQVRSEDVLRRLKPDFAALAKLPGYRGVAVTAVGGKKSGFDFVSRFFGPAIGINEDPVTGSAHCMLAPFWSARLGKTDLMARQLSERGGIVRAKLCGKRVALYGQAVITLKGRIR